MEQKDLPLITRRKRSDSLLPLGLVVVLFFLCSACDSCGQGGVKPSKETLDIKPPVGAQPEKQAPVGVVEGIVRLKEGTRLPSFPEEMMSQQVIRSKPKETPKMCSPFTPADRQPVRLAEYRALIGVLVAASKLKQPPERPAKIHEIAIEDCRLKPSFVAAQKGDKLRIRNRTDFPFMPQFGRSAFMETLIKGQEKVFNLDEGGFVGKILCGYTALCGRTDVVVLFDAIHAITDDNGRFRIENYPAGQESLLNVWHPLFQETSTPIVLAPGETKTIEIEISPIEKYALEASEKKPVTKSR
ncbi:MAG: carboxypeptidase regulatory-like domain-containing protein [Deltaproteobacteria bacterium]|nr:carboxypeptidase regulatory-like domain-containing protein [Deltaproteobacteria bacterium]